MYVIKLQFPQERQENISDEEIRCKFKKQFDRMPAVIRDGMGEIYIHSSLNLSEKKIRMYANNFGTLKDIEGCHGNFTIDFQ